MAHDREQVGLDGAGDGQPFGAQHFDQVAVAVAPAGDDDALKVEALFDAEFDGGADALVNAGADAFESSYLLGVAEAVGLEFLYPGCRDRALAGGESSLAVEPADVTGLVHEASVGLGTLMPTGRKLGVAVCESPGGFEGDDSLGVHDDAQALGVGEPDQVEQQVVLGLEDAGDAG